ncbi:MAG: V-type ATP synthase subunit D [Candidatus Heimdallarchaeota archaeon]
MSSIEGVNATRMALLGFKTRLNLAQKGHDLLREKMDALVMEFFGLLEDVKKAREEVFVEFKKAFSALIEAKMLMGPVKLREVALGVPYSLKIRTETKNIMGVRVPLLQLETPPEKASSLFYGFSDTSAKLDECIKAFQDVLRHVLHLAELQATLSRLAQEISDTKRRVNALNYILIPRLQAFIAWINLMLAEREREEFVRLKKIKKRLEAASAL